MNPKLLAGLVIAVVIAVVALSISSVYSAYVSSTSHRNTCARADLILDTLHDVIVLALTPAPGKTLTSEQVKQIQNFETSAFARINEARC